MRYIFKNVYAVAVYYTYPHVIYLCVSYTRVSYHSALMMLGDTVPGEWDRLKRKQPVLPTPNSLMSWVRLLYVSRLLGCLGDDIHSMFQSAYYSIISSITLPQSALVEGYSPFDPSVQTVAS